jgi:beta-xylosidase
VDGTVAVSCTVRNTGSREGAEVVQLYLSDPVASVVRPVRQLVGFARVELAAGAAARVRFTVHADRTSFTGRDLQRVVEAGDVVLSIGASSEDLHLEMRLRLTGPDRIVATDRVLTTPVEVRPV